MARILVVEDNPTIAMVMEIALTDEGHEVVIGNNGMEGLAIMQSKRIPDLVLTDLNMSGIDGRDLISKMRDNDQLRNIPAVIITGSIPNPRILPESHQFQGLLIKPFDINELVNTVARLTCKQVAR